MDTCPFCRFFADGLPEHGLYKEENCIAVLDSESLGFGHCMVIPRRHVTEFHELTESEFSSCFRLAKLLAPILKRVTGTVAVGYVVFGSGLPHAHLHLVPHDDSDVLLRPLDHVRQRSEAELRADAARLRPIIERDLVR